MYQLYLLVIIYLLIGAGLLLVDEYGGRYIILIRLRNSVRHNFLLQLSLVIVGLFLSPLVFFFPVDPGPILFGDFIPLVFIVVLLIYHVSQLVLGKKHGMFDGEDAQRFRPPGFTVPPESQEDVLKKTGSLIETHRRNLGYLVLASALLHFLFPSAVLL